MGTTRSFGSIRQLPSGRYQARYRHLGRRITADTTFKTKAEARVFLSSVETDLMRGTYRDPQAGNILFDEARRGASSSAICDHGLARRSTRR
jgi:hypothetical protein